MITIEEGISLRILPASDAVVWYVVESNGFFNNFPTLGGKEIEVF